MEFEGEKQSHRPSHKLLAIYTSKTKVVRSFALA